VLYHLVNRRDEALAERAYCPWPDMEREMRRADVPMFSLESRMPLGAFDLVGFSLSYELTYTNVLTMLDLAGIPLFARDRTDEHPIVIGGGATMANPEPIADFFDAFLIGDGEEAIDRIIDTVKEHRESGGERHELLESLANIEGMYIPQFYRIEYRDDGTIERFVTLNDSARLPVRRHIIHDLKPEYAPDRPLVPVMEVAQDRLSIEVLRGCTQGCRFCQAGFFYRPVRERSPEEVIEIAQAGIDSGGWDDIALLSLSTADHSRAEELVERVSNAFKDRGVSISLPSLRADRFSLHLCETAGEVKKNGFTFAPETGSERLRRVINKNVSKEEMIQAARVAFEKGWRLIKLYFMIGLPTETMDDVQSIIDLTDEIANVGRAIRSDARVNASVGCFVPKTFTPFQWTAFAGVDTLNERLRYLQTHLTNRAVKLKWHRPEEAWLEAVISRGDRNLSKVIYEAWKRGARFDGWTEWSNTDRWRDAFRTVELDPDQYLMERDPEETLPWDVIDIGVSKRYLKLEWKRAHEEQRTQDCRHGDCNACGIPGMPDDNVLTADRERKLLSIEAEDRAVNETKRAHTIPGQGFGGGTYRIRYEVDEPFRFVGHSDLMRTFHRACEIANLDVAMSQGYTPRPKAGFGPPVPHGCTSAGEYLDLELNVGVDDLVGVLNGTLPEGIRVLASTRIGEKADAISAVIGAAEYEFTFDADVMSPEDVVTRLTEFDAADKWEATKVNAKGKERVVDLKHAIIAHRVRHMDSRSIVTTIGRLNDPNGNNINPLFVLEHVFGLDEERRTRVVMRRSELYDRSGRPMSGIAWGGQKPRHLHSRSREFFKFLDT
ncbi:MAG TPA: TIGR03960 family B12-binding radical SAM protein, partial [Firmicutes bacterium]|nr:TIGR03960 family B12-binding radical SAM protein [Bacillota bacterium]